MKMDPMTDENEAYGQLGEEARSPDYHSFGYMDETDLTIAATQTPADLITVSNDTNYYEIEDEIGMTTNKAYAGTRVTDVEVATDANKLSGTAEMAMIRNEAYAVTRDTVPDVEHEDYYYEYVGPLEMSNM